MKVNSCQTCFCRFNIPYNISVAVTDHFMMFLKHDLFLKMTAKKSSERSTKKYVYNIPQCVCDTNKTLHYIEDSFKIRPSKPWITCSFPCISPNNDWLFKLPEIRPLSLSPTSLFIFLKIWQIVPLKWILNVV